MGNVIRDLKVHTADRLIRHHRAEGDKSLLDFLASVVTRPEKQQYKVWENGYFAKDVFSAEFLRQKMIYVHNNPCQPHWNLAERPKDYIWSSAGFYLLEEPCIIPLDNANFLLA